jgi:hypothetical protein
MSLHLGDGRWRDDCETPHTHKSLALMERHYAKLHHDDPEHYNYWGTLKSTIDSDEYCVECERELPFHYDSCPER